MAAWIALLRGINVGGHRRIPMADLRAALESLGYEDVRTLGQSGNVVLRCADSAAAVETAIGRVIEERCGVDGVLVVVRSRDQLAHVVKANPWPDRTGEPKNLHVTFLSAPPGPAAREKVEAAAAGGEAVVWADGHLYALYVDGMRDSAMAKLITDRTLGVTATDRNWNTVTKLLELAG
ncbi:MAG: hypothetical protein QOE86_2003 [Solirubrobacteraceae bacterium]|nr:hypothetical protein [Solirubrobacteraceae bacterium]